MKDRMTRKMEISKYKISGAISRGRWGEPEREKGPVDLFPGEPTDEGAARPVDERLARTEAERRLRRGDLGPWVQCLLRRNKKELSRLA